MALALVPHLADAAGRLHVWVGVAGVRPAPTLTFTVDGQPATPRALRPLTLVPAGNAAATPVHTGVFEFDGLPVRTPVWVGVSGGGESIERQVIAPPTQVPDDPADRFNVLLLSCFHQLEDKAGKAGDILSRLGVRPDLTVFGGDQVYLDLPTLENFEDNDDWLRNKFQNDYLANWFGDREPPADPRELPVGYSRVLGLAPGVFMPDDHEYWNNYPFAATVIGNSWSEAGRRLWEKAANDMYRAFQENPASALGKARIIRLPPLSILLLDTRSQRDAASRDKAGDLLGAAGAQALTDWVTELEQAAQSPQPTYGMLVTGQSLFSPAAGAAKGAIEDYEYPDYPPDYKVLVDQVERLTKAGLPIILATGDVHWGRLLSAVDPAEPGAPVFEVISSPTSLVSSVGVDQAKRLFGVIKSIFGPSDPFPRHSDAAAPPSRFGSNQQYAPQVLTRTGTRDTPTTMRGDQAFMLRFGRAGSNGLNVEVTCYPLSGDAVFDATQQWSATLELRPPRA